MIDFDKTIKVLALVLCCILVSFVSVSAFTYYSNSKNLIFVTGNSNQDYSNQVAEFTATFTTENKDKNISNQQNNEKISKFLASVKEFGIEDKDVKTLELSSYQINQNFNTDPSFKNRIGNWVFTQSVSIKIRDVSKVNGFSNLMAQNQTSQTSGPNFSIDTTNINQDDLYQKAYNDAQHKAEVIATNSGRKLGKAVSISEGSVPTIFPMAAPRLGASMGGAEVPSGSTNLSKTLYITFELN
jgi:hypothetical protein